LDVGCGVGHYLRSLKNQIDVPFGYLGVDPTRNYIDRAKDVFHGSSVDFAIMDIYDLQLRDNYADIVMCNNVLLHLPSIQIPIQELLRVSKKYVIIRTLIGENSFRIKQVEKPEIYNRNGEPLHYHYFNIYAESYIRNILTINELLSDCISFDVTITDDRDFDPKNFGGTENYLNEKPHDLTTMLNGYQLNNYVLEPWKFVIIKKNGAER
jgi:ubiquinone/menaquinone biosynthesis C-methylase UbiE